MELNRISLRGATFGRVSLRGVSLIGRTGGEPAQDFEGYPLAIDINSARRTQSYTIYGNTDENAQGVGREIRQGIVDNLAEVTSRGYTFGIVDRKVYIRGDRTQVGEIVNKCGEVNGGHKYLWYSDTSLDDVSLCLQLFAAGHDAIYLLGNSGVITPAFDMSVYLQIDKGNHGHEMSLSHIAPRMFDLTLAGWEDINTPAELVARLGLKEVRDLWEKFPYGSSFVAPIRVGSRNLWDEETKLGYITPQTGIETPSTSALCSANFSRTAGGKSLCLLKKDTTAYIAVVFYDKDFGFLDYWGITGESGRIITTPINAAYFKISFASGYGTSYNNNVCINYSDERNGEYSPYFAPTLYPSVLSSPLHKIGDIVDYKESNGKEGHYFGHTKLNFNWYEKALADNRVAYYTVSGVMERLGIKPAYRTTPNLRASVDWTPVAQGASSWGTHAIVLNPISGTIPNVGSIVIIENVGTYASLEAFSEAMKSVDLVYELATPTEVQGEPLPRLAIPKGESIVTLDTAVEPSNITAKV